jgi:hypothetical protein
MEAARDVHGESCMWQGERRAGGVGGDLGGRDRRAKRRPGEVGPVEVRVGAYRGVPATARKPEWLKKLCLRLRRWVRMDGPFGATGLHTVCEAAACPTGENALSGARPLSDTRRRLYARLSLLPISQAVGRKRSIGTSRRGWRKRLLTRLVHLVITSVTRDDLPDGGARSLSPPCAPCAGLLPEATVEGWCRTF